MACFKISCLNVLQVLGSVIFFFFTISLSPILIAFYLMFWIRAKLTALIYSTKKYKFLTGEDAMSGMDIDSTNCIINGIVITKGRFTMESMKELVLNKVINPKNVKDKPMFPKFSSCIVLRAGYLMWSKEEDFSINDHVRYYDGQLPRDESALKDKIAELCNKKIVSKSGWEIILIPLETDFDIPLVNNPYIKIPQTCILIRVHHSIADGLSLVRLIIEELADNGGNFKNMLRKLISKLKPKSKNVLVILLLNLVTFLYAFVFAPAVQCKQAVTTKDKNLVHGPKLTGIKIFDWTSNVKLETVKDIRTATSTTVNDVIMSCLAGALRRYFLKQKVDSPAFLHSVIPVNLQGPDDPISMKNNISFVFAHLPTGEMDCLQRLKATKTIMDELKHSPDIIANHWFIKHCINVIPQGLMKWFIDISPVSVIFSNVPGPPDTLRIQSHKINAIIPFLPHRGTIGVGVCVFSYSNEVTVSISVDTALISNKADVRMLLEGFIEEMQELVNAVNI